MIIPYGTRQIVQLDSFYVTDSPLSVTTIAERAKFYSSFNDYPLGDSPVCSNGQFK